MNPALIAALINSVAIPELTTWLRSLHDAGTPLTDAVIIQKLSTDTQFGIMAGTAWLAAHPAT